ncbi:MAG: DedA family protein [Bacteroidaceae bacterium]|nr:DedA family protein [Bacteroidaceae bacterium]
MDSLNEFFISYGYWGMGIASFFAGTFFPFSSEAVMAALLATTSMDPVLVVVSGTIGNVLGSMVNYFIGSLCKPQTVSRIFHIKPERMDTAQQYVMKYGAWMGFFTFAPILGTAISLALGMLKANVWYTFLTTFLGKTVRYVIVAYSVLALK